MRTLITDITDSGQVFNALTSTLEVHEFAPSLRAPKIDAVVHFAAIPRIMMVPDNETFRINTMGTYNIVEAAEKLGIRKTIIASQCGSDRPHAAGHPADQQPDQRDALGTLSCIGIECALGRGGRIATIVWGLGAVFAAFFAVTSQIM